MTHALTSILLLHLVDVFDEACAVFEQDSGEAPSHDIEVLLARRIADIAKAGERDPGRLMAFALEGLIESEYSMNCPLH